MSIRSKILASIAFSVFVAAACAAGIVYQQSQKDALEDFGFSSREQLRLAGDYMALLMRDARGITRALSEMSIMQEAEGHLTRYMDRAEPFSTDVNTLSDYEKSICAIFSSYIRAFPAYAIIYMGTADGGFVEMPDLRMTPHFDSRQRPWYQAAMASPDKTVMTEPYFSDTGDLVYTLAHTVRNGEKRIIGVIGIDITLKGLTDYLAAIPVGEGGQVVLTDERGTVLYNLIDSSMAEDAKRRAENARREGVAHTAERLDGIVLRLGDAGRQLSEQAGVINSSVENQLQRTRDTASAMNQMNEAVADVARNASDAAHVAEQAKEETQAGKRSVDDVMSGISEVEHCSDEISASMAGLVRQVDDIGQVMNVINDIADQTNLLALNAAIEAARAGEAGRGFAVVADEVRKLAEKTMQATKSVGQAIQDIQRGAAESDRLIGKSVEYVRASTELAGKAGEALQRIEQMVLTTADQVRAIAAASEEQSATAEEVNRHTGDVSRIAEEVAHAMEVATASMGNLSSQVDALQRVMAELREDGRA